MRAPDIRVSIVIPAYNEARRLADTLPEVVRYLSGRSEPSEILVVDDGSSDETTAVARRVAAGAGVPVRCLRCPTNRGKGHALKVGFAHAEGAFLLFTDADLSTPIDEAGRVLALLENGEADLVIGSRKMHGARIEVHQPTLREGMGKVFTFIVRRLLVDVSDVTCGFKGFAAAPGRDLFSHTRLHDWSFDAEVLFLARARGYRIVELPVRWADHDDTKVHMLRAALTSLWGLLRIRWYAARGLYAVAAPSSDPVEVAAAP